MFSDTEQRARPKIHSINVTEFRQWSADNERMVRAGLLNTGPGPLDYDEKSLETVQKRCLEMLGEYVGLRYYQNLIATFPQRNKELFPELYDENGRDKTC
jgi:hypothetical protein